MCRFLIIKSENVFNPQKYLEDFTDMAQKSRTPEKDKQEDGWGVTWRLKGDWQSKKNLKPIWECRKSFGDIKSAKLLMVHARSASFEIHKRNLEFNQPFTDGELAFVFNGLVKGVKLEREVEGKIGAKKIFNLVRELKNNDLKQSLLTIHDLLENSSRKIKGLNIGLATENKIAALCAYGQNRNYFTLYHYNKDGLSVIASEPVGNHSFKTMKNNQVQVY